MVTKFYISLDGFNKLNAEAKTLRDKIDAIVIQIKENKETETGDEFENVEFIQLMAERELVSEKYAELQSFLLSCNTVDIASLPDETNVVKFGTQVKLLDLHTNKKFTYKILGERESNLKDNIISYLSPLGRALMNEQIGNIVSFDAPKGERELEILSISRHNIF